MRRPLALVGFSVLALASACGDDLPNEFDTKAEESGTTETGTPADLPAETSGGASDEVGDGDGDGDGDPTTGDGDGDGDDTGLPACGNGIVEAGEQCDGAELGGVGCENLGYTSGTLACDPVTCTYDPSGCTVGGDGGGGGTTG